MFKNKKVIAVNALVLAALLFGSTFIIVKNLLDDLSPTTVVGDKSSSKFFTIIKVDPNNKAARTKALTAITFLFLNI